jgi:DNA (cytosine-5)-methyltransferase 1
LFDGAGTCPFAAKQYGVKTLWSSEIEAFPLQVTAKRFPDVEQLGDITAIDGTQIKPVDIITFGSPCQDLSVAGKRAGLDGDRSKLFSEAVRIIKEMQNATNGKYPRFAMWENVPGAYSSNGGDDFRVVLEELCRIKEADISIPRPSGKGGAATMG